MGPSLFWVSFPSGSPSEPDGAAAKARLPFKRQQKRMHLVWEVLGGEGNGNRSLREPWWSETCWSRSVAHLVLCLFPAWLMFSGCWRAFVKLLSFSYSAHSSQSIKPVKVLPSCFGSWCGDFVNLLPEGSGFDSLILSAVRGVKLGFLQLLPPCPQTRVLSWTGDVSHCTGRLQPPPPPDLRDS